MSNPKRVSGQQRIEAWNVAEREIQRFAHDDYLFSKLPIRQLIRKVHKTLCFTFSKLPIRQLIGIVRA